jgi:uncharacterized MnhB-related membrane protein
MLTARNVVDAGLIVALLVSTIQAIRARRLIISALWLASASAVLSILFYQLGGVEVAVFELSIGAGLVTVLFVFAISIAGEDAMRGRPILPRPLAWALAGGAVLLLALLAPGFGTDVPTIAEPSFAEMLWQQRGLDVLVQIVLIFAGVIGLLGLLAEEKAPLEPSVADELKAERDRALMALDPTHEREKDIV